MNEEILQLKKRIEDLENKFTTRGVDNDLVEMIRDTVFFDSDSTSAKLTQSATDSNGDTVTIGTIPTIFLKIYYRGKVLYVGAVDNPT